ncbi:hypothetical protein [Pararhizobium gei]|uniref:hypothetical protein n=1 Tax=Pararhizobium gei TaxID=1395951 RepID=UPI0023D99D1D|nr:hypothetical protein [Rhizobium gei]
MSAILSVATPEAVYLLTDGATYDRDGVVHSISCKVTAARTVPFVVATRGDKAQGDRFDAWISEGADRFGIEDILAALSAKMPQWRKSEEFRAAVSGENMVEVTLAGWTEQRGGFCLRFSTEGDDAFEMVSLDLADYAGPFDGGDLSWIRMPEHGENPETWIRTQGLEMMEHFRSHLGKSVAGWPQFYGIGGQCDLTTVTAEGAHTETLRTWPDVVGEKINPDRKAA